MHYFPNSDLLTKRQHKIINRLEKRKKKLNKTTRIVQNKENNNKRRKTLKSFLSVSERPFECSVIIETSYAVLRCEVLKKRAIVRRAMQLYAFVYKNVTASVFFCVFKRFVRIRSLGDALKIARLNSSTERKLEIALKRWKGRQMRRGETGRWRQAGDGRFAVDEYECASELSCQ